MKKRMLVVLVIVAMISPVAQAALPTETEPLEFILGAGVNQFETGTVTVWLDGDDLFVNVETHEPWLLTDLHIIAVEDLNNIPVSNPVCRCPQFGHFPYGVEFDDPTEAHTAQINIAWDQQGPLYVMIHASVVNEDDDSTETAFAHGENFGSTRFAYYIMIVPDPNGDDPNGDDPNGDDPNGDDPNGDDPNGDDPNGDDPNGDDPNGEDPNGDDPDGDENGTPADDEPEICYWYPHLSGIANNLMAAAWNGNMFVAVGEGGGILHLQQGKNGLPENRAPVLTCSALPGVMTCL